MGKTLFALLATGAHWKESAGGAGYKLYKLYKDCFCKKIKRRQLGAQSGQRCSRRRARTCSIQSKVFLRECHCLTSMILHIKGIWGNRDVSAHGPSLQGTHCFCFVREKKRQHVWWLHLTFKHSDWVCSSSIIVSIRNQVPSLSTGVQK